jgi:hypothetical protein
LNLESLNFLAQTNSKIKELLDEQKAEIVKNGVSPIDFVRFNDKSNSENLQNVKIMRLKRFQRTMKRLSKMSKALKKMGRESFQTGGIIYDLIGDSINFDKNDLTSEQLWQQFLLETIDFKMLITDITLEMVRDKVQHI